MAVSLVQLSPLARGELAQFRPRSNRAAVGHTREHASELTWSGQERGVPAIGKLNHIGCDALARRAPLPASTYDAILPGHKIAAGYVGP